MPVIGGSGDVRSRSRWSAAPTPMHYAFVGVWRAVVISATVLASAGCGSGAGGGGASNTSSSSVNADCAALESSASELSNSVKPYEQTPEQMDSLDSEITAVFDQLKSLNCLPTHSIPNDGPPFSVASPVHVGGSVEASGTACTAEDVLVNVTTTDQQTGLGAVHAPVAADGSWHATVPIRADADVSKSYVANAVCLHEGDEAMLQYASQPIVVTP
jgi:hypothetical protein